MVRGYLFRAFFLPFTAIACFSALVSTYIDPSGRMFHAHCRLWSLIGLLAARVHLEVYGRENVPAEGPVVFMSNHQGNFDIMSLYQAIPRHFAWMAKKELFTIPLFGRVMTRAGYIPVDRSDARKALRSLSAAAEKIQQGRSVVIFPEGTRSNDGKLLPFKRGGFILAVNAGVPVVPVAIHGSLDINPPNQIQLRPGTIQIAFGAPLAVFGREPQELQEMVRKQINTLLEDMSC